ncbi:uncharacterized protein [Primulina eburnea]|uniref:uncharacterized protein n=1 Tax=Primulina eburnea TaxID=1245227 RepID=UPI003C6CBB86
MGGRLGDQALEIHQVLEIHEFEPFCKWQRKEDRDILEVHLQDFKKEQLKVQISHQGTLKISGERSISPSGKSKFYKEITISNIYDSSTISAKFVNGWLCVTMLKRERVVPEKDDQKALLSNHIRDANAKIEDKFRGRKRAATGLKFGKTAVTVAAMGVAVATLVAYVIYMYKSTVVEVDDCNY